MRMCLYFVPSLFSFLLFPEKGRLLLPFKKGSSTWAFDLCGLSSPSSLRWELWSTKHFLFSYVPKALCPYCHLSYNPVAILKSFLSQQSPSLRSILTSSSCHFSTVLFQTLRKTKHILGSLCSHLTFLNLRFPVSYFVLIFYFKSSYLIFQNLYMSYNAQMC